MKKRILLTLSIIILVTSFILFDLFLRESDSSILIQAESDSTEVIFDPVKLEYGIPVDDYMVDKSSIKRNQSLSVVLSGYNISPYLIDQIAQKALDIFDLRKVRIGNNYVAFLTRDSLSSLDYFIYEHTPVEYLKISFKDSIDVTFEKKEITESQKSISGVIETSLWNTLADQNVNPVLSHELSDIYAWVIDFFALQPNDSFRVAYTENFVDSVPIGIKQVDYAVFFHENKPYYAIPFMQDSVLSFYDENGESLKKAFLKAPLRYSRISSGFSHSRMHPVLRIRRPHHGVDYAAPTGTPVLSVGDGKIIAKAWDSKGGGNYIKIKHNGTYTTAYLHLNGFAKGMQVGKTVRQGEVIGYVGKTGLATGPHLDFRFYKDGHPVDPIKVKSPPVQPVADSNRTEFDAVKLAVIEKLSGIKSEKHLPHAGSTLLSEVNAEF